MRQATFADAAVGEGASALNRVFERYLVPITFSSEQLHLHMTYNDVDASASPIWYDEDGKVLAAALLAIRGKRGWIGGFGVAPEHRGHGYAAELIETIVRTARERGLDSIQLELLADNLPAMQVYRHGGFAVTRKLHSFERLIEESDSPRGFINAAPLDFIDLRDPAPPCWQRERSTLRNGAVSSAVTDTKGNYALFRYNAQAAQVLKIDARDTKSLDALANAIAARRDFQSVLLLNEPEESPVAQYAIKAHWNEPFLQYEMRLEL